MEMSALLRQQPQQRRRRLQIRNETKRYLAGEFHLEHQQLRLVDVPHAL